MISQQRMEEDPIEAEAAAVPTTEKEQQQAPPSSSSADSVGDSSTVETDEESSTMADYHDDDHHEGHDAVLPAVVGRALITPEKEAPKHAESSGHVAPPPPVVDHAIITPEKEEPKYVERSGVTVKDHKGFSGVYTGRLLRVAVQSSSSDNDDDDSEHNNKNMTTTTKVIFMPHGNGRMEYTDNPMVSSYEGHWKDGAWDGQGQARLANGDSYAGEHRQGMRHGSGTYRWPDGRKYSGMFSHDLRHGQGSYEWPCGAVHSGAYVNGVRTGYGQYTDPTNGVGYTGDWENGKYHGYGILTTDVVDGDDNNNGPSTTDLPKRVYRGHFKQGLAHGHGVEVSPDGSIFHDGEWEHGEPVLDKQQPPQQQKESEFVVVEKESIHDANGLAGIFRGILHRETRLPHGNGTLHYDARSQLEINQKHPNDCLDHYEGCFNMGRYHGRGRLYWTNGDSYDGEYVEGLRQGPGVYRWSDGRHYKGEFYEDLRHGFGKFVYGKQSADWYEGEFVKGRREGRGRFVFADGSVYNGEWKEGVYHGQGKLVSSSEDGGKTYIGTFNQGLAHGWGKELGPDGNILYEGNWINGDTEPEARQKAELAKKRLAAQATLRQPRRDKESTTARGGPPEPDCEAVVDIEVLDAEGNPGQYTGLVLVKNQKPHGVGRMVYLDGRRIHEGFWKNGLKDGHGRCLFVEQGDFHEGEYKDNVRHGLGTYKWKDGRIFVGQYVNDKRNGKGVFTYPNGEQYEGNFVEGEKQGFGRFEFRGGFYEGLWQQGRYHGKGRLCVRGDVLEGIFCDGLFVGKPDVEAADEPKAVHVVTEDDLDSIALNEESGADIDNEDHKVRFQLPEE